MASLHRQQIFASLLSAALMLVSGCVTGPGMAEKKQFKEDVMQGRETLKIAEAFLTAAGSGDMNTLSSLMADDFVWHNEGDKSIPWIGTWEGKDTVLNTFLPRFGAGLKTTGWTTDYSMAMADQAVFVGTMSGITNASGAGTGTFSWAVRVQVVDGKVLSWNWFEDSYAISRAFHAE
ncbi:MAG: nuclear transport factor 2 family protein [Pseudomonadota bacterium]